MPDSLSEIEIAFITLGLTLLIFALQGFVSVFLEGRELHVGRIYPHLTRRINLILLISSLLLLVIAIVLGGGIALGWGVKAIGSLAGLGALLLGFMLIPYKEGFVGGEAHFDDRNDGVPW
jgi:hypothetical protein